MTILPQQPVTLTVEQIALIEAKLSTLRHDTNNHVGVITASTYLAVRGKKPLGEVEETVGQRAMDISRLVKEFSEELHQLLGIRQQDPSSGSMPVTGR